MNGSTGTDMIVIGLVLLSAIHGASVYAIAKLALMGRPIVESVPEKQSGHTGN